MKKKIINCVQGVTSPLLSNIYLHEALDKWYAKEIRSQLKGRSFMIRFADDAILGFENQEEAEYVMKALKDRLAGYGLELHPEKTRLVYFDKPNSNKSGHLKPGSFDFLGFTHYWDKSLKGNWIVKRKTSKKKFREKLKSIKQWCKKNRHMPMKEQHETLCRKINGHYGYYGITGNARSLSQYRYEVTRTWKKWLCRRSKRGYRLNWDRFNKLKVVHSIYRVAKP